MSDESWASSSGVRRSMQSNRGRDTGLELAVRKRLHADGLRYRVDFAPVPGFRRRADLVFTRLKLAVFLDGCFWHGCPLHSQVVQHNATFWAGKLARNVERDLETTRVLAENGWTVLRYWEHQPVESIVEDIETAVSLARAREGEEPK